MYLLVLASAGAGGKDQASGNQPDSEQGPSTRPPATQPSGPAFSGAVVKHLNLGDERLALAGYDPVSYFNEDRPLEGQASVTLKRHGVVYRFANEGNRSAFEENPDEYRIAYGGWCAYAMSRGRKLDVDPLNYAITRGRLMLFYRDQRIDHRVRWESRADESYPRAEFHWGRISGVKSDSPTSQPTTAPAGEPPSATQPAKP
mgnify:FL=1